MDTLALSPLNIDPTCFKNSKNPSYIDLLPTNFKPNFMKASIFETGISDHHKMISTIMKLHFTKESPKTKYYRDYRKFDIDYFSSELSRQLDSIFCSIKENADYEESNEFGRFHRVFLNLLNIQATLKKIILRGNNSPFMTKTLRKAFMIRSKLKKRFHKTRSDESCMLYKTQRNLCTKLLRKTKNTIFQSYTQNLYRAVKASGKLLNPISQTKATFLTK